MYLVCSVLITLFLLLHDWINIYPLNDLETFNKYCSFRNKVWMTIVNTPFFIVYTLILLYYWSTPFPLYAKIYLILCNMLFGAGILFSWWVPYFFGWPISQVQELQEMYGKTHAFLPRIDDHPVPNTLHVMFHAIFIVNMIVTFVLIFAF